MADETPAGTESGKEFREKLESAITDRKALLGLVAETYGLKPSDLDGTPVDQIPTRAAELQEARKREREALVREELQARGLSEEQIDALVSGEGTSVPTRDPEPPREAELANVGGAPFRGSTTDWSNMTEQDLIVAGIREEKRKR